MNRVFETVTAFRTVRYSNGRCTACLLKCLFGLLLFLYGTVRAVNCPARGNQYNINIYNGAPSNHVYNTFIDSKGYLWMATNKGVAKYDGHNLKIFDLTRGFVNKDVWALFEDKKGRIWLYSISNNLGYIYKDQYHSITNNIVHGVFYPKFEMADDYNGVCFVSTINNSTYLYLCQVQNDTLKKVSRLDRYGDLIALTQSHLAVALNKGDSLCYVEIHPDTLIYRRPANIIAANGEDSIVSKMVQENYFTFNRYIVSYNTGRDFIRVLDTRTARYSRLYISQLSKERLPEPINMISAGNNNVSIITGRHIYTLDTLLHPLAQYSIDSISTGVQSNDISFFLDNPFWGKAIATLKNGVYMLYDKWDTAYKQDIYFDPSDDAYLGNISDTTAFWWRKATGTLVRTTPNRRVTYKKVDATGVQRVTALNDSSFFLLCMGETIQMNSRTLAVEKRMAFPASDAVIYSPSEYYFISKTQGLYGAKVQDTTSATYLLENDRLNGIAYDSLRDIIWAHNSSKAIVYKKGHHPIVIAKDILERFGLNSLVKILPDRYGNLFIQEDGRLLLFRYPSGPVVPVLSNYILNDAQVHLMGNILVVAGTFGVLFSKITGPGQLSAPIIYPNIKHTRYNVVYAMGITGNEVLLKTDRGPYIVNIPPAELLGSERNKFTLPYKLILSYAGRQYNMANPYTVSINRRAPKLQFDMINPMGDGPVRYKYLINDRYSSWQAMTTNELTLPAMAAGRQYRLSVIAYDNQWQSNVMTTGLYIEPYWWEKKMTWRLLWITGVLLVALLVYIIVLVTKRIVSRNHAKRNLQLELELKSVYSQINPHFIFNSLGVAMYLVKTKRLDDAYQHIHKFSHLLRSYIRSSRNRLIPLGDEIANLKNYIELQQARFSNKFGYEIVVDDSVSLQQPVPSLLLQPIVENAIAHGLLHKEEQGHLRISFTAHGSNELVCTIEDDGIGRERSKLMKDEHMIKEESYGNLLIEDLITIFNKYEKMKIGIAVTDRRPPLTGTLVTLTIKHHN